MRTFLKILKIALLTFLLAIVALVVAGWLMQDRITKLAIEKVSETIKAPMGMESVSFSLIRDFPLATVQFKNVWLGAGQSNQSASIDTLAKFERLFIAVESKPLLDNIFNVQEIEVETGALKYRVDEQGISCFDFLVENNSESSSEVDSTASPRITLKKLTLKDITCLYNDENLKAKARIYIDEIEGSGNIDSLGTNIMASGNVRLTGLGFDQSPLNKMQQANLQFDAHYAQDSLILKNLAIETEGATINTKGKVSFGEEMKVDLTVSASKLDLAELTKYVPSEHFQTYQISELTGNLDVEAKIKGAVSDSLVPHCDAKFNLTEGTVKWKRYPLVTNISINGSATNGALQHNISTAIDIDNLALKCNGNALRLKGHFHNLDHLSYDLKTNIGLDLGGLRPFIPDSVAHAMKGQVYANIQTKGILPDSIDDKFTDYLLQTSKANFRFKNVDIDLDSALIFRQISGQLQYKNNEIALDSFNISLPTYHLSLINNSVHAKMLGRFSDLDATNIEIPSFYLATGGSAISGDAFIKSLSHPSLATKSKLDIDLAELKKFIPDSTVKNMQGKVIANFDSGGAISLDSLSEQIANLIYDHSTFDLDFKDVRLDMPDTLLSFQKLNGYVNATPQMVTVKNLSGVYNGIDLQLDTTVIKNLYSTVFRDQPGRLKVEGVLRTSNLDYNMLGAFMGDEEEVDTLHSTTSDPAKWDYEIKGKLFVPSLKYKNALIEDISTLFNVKDSLYLLDELKFKAFGGNMNSALRIAFNRNGQMELFTRNQVDHMDIRRLLHDMDNFDQAVMTDKNISGILTTDQLFTKLVFAGDSVILPETRMTGDFKLENGGIYNFEPVKALESVPGIDRADTLLFKTIDNHIFVLRDTLYVPETNIVSNKFNISVIGRQSFAMDYEYHLEIYLKEMLFGMSEKRKKKEEADHRKPKWVRQENHGGKIITRIVGNKSERETMRGKVNASRSILKLKFFPTIVKFETNVGEKFRSYDKEKNQ